MHAILVLAGTSPSKQLLQDCMSRSDLVVAADGGANIFHKYDLEPDMLIGDLDSVTSHEWPNTSIVHISDQETTDLEKALRFLLEKDVKAIRILGGLGGRTDHLLNNLNVCAQVDPDIDITFIHDDPHADGFSLESIYRLTPKGRMIQVDDDSLVSVSSVVGFSGLTSVGLKWEILDANAHDGFFSQSNRATASELRFTLEDGICYISVYQ